MGIVNVGKSLIALSLLVATASAQTAPITSVFGGSIWTSATATTGIAVDGVGSSNDLYWGTTPTPESPHTLSRLTFQYRVPLNFNSDSVFEIGRLFYNNISGTKGLTAAETQVSIDFHNGVDSHYSVFNLGFSVDDTPDTLPCTYASTTPCADRIGLSSLFYSDLFALGGVTYKLKLLGWGTTAASLGQTELITDEGTSSGTTSLWAMLDTIVIVPVTTIPEPGMAGLLAFGLLGMFGLRRLRSV